MKTLCFDFGNTRQKVAVFRNDVFEEEITLPNDEMFTIERVMYVHQPQRTILASVINHNPAIESLLASQSKFHKLSHLTKINFTTPVGKPETIGADRLALSAAAVHFHPGKNNLVIGLGSCITYNFINQYNEFLGGSISPGMHMRFKAMEVFTAKLPEVHAASGMAVAPGQPVFNDISLFKPGGDMNSAVDIRFTFTDQNYFKTLKINLIAGRAFEPTDTSTQMGVGNIVINEMALKKLGIPSEQAPGTVLRSEFQDRHVALTIIGVMKNFNFQSLSHELEPFMVLMAPPNDLMQVAADVHTSDYAAFFRKAEGLWRDLLPGLPYEHSFLDQDFAKLYESEQTLTHIIGAFTLIAILISCLGLFGLSVFTAEQRTKEIGIRKVLGASVAGLTGLLAKDFLKLVFIAIVIAAPVAWWAMNKWLTDFAYHIDIKWWMFASAGAAAVAVAFLTVSFQSVRAALANPVKSLRSE